MGVVAFPRVPEAVRPHVADSAVLRRFGGAAADLDVDFGAGRAELTSTLVAACADPPVSRGVAARLPISVRIRAVLRLAAAAAPIAEVACACACGEQLEVALPLAEIAADPPRVVDVVEVAGRTVRVPTGEDLREADPLAIARALIPDLDEAELPALAAALDAADPLVCFHITASCPACGVALRHDVDLEAIAHRVLAAAQHGLLDTIHRLASAYHWSERDVLALPPQRSAHYLARIERGER